MGAAAGGRLDAEAAVDGLNPVAQAAQPGAIGSAPPRPSSSTVTRTRPSPVTTDTRAHDASACLTMLASDSAATKYAVASTAGGSRPALTSCRTGTGVRRARAANAGPIPSSVSTAGCDPVCEVAQLAERVHDLGVGLRQETVDAVGAAIGETHPGCTQGEANAQQALLRAVVQVALQPTSLRVAGLDDARS